MYSRVGYDQGTHILNHVNQGTLVCKHQSDCDQKFKSTLWEYHTNYIIDMSDSLFWLALGLEVVLLVIDKHVVPKARLQVEHKLDERDA